MYQISADAWNKKLCTQTWNHRCFKERSDWRAASVQISLFLHSLKACCSLVSCSFSNSFGSRERKRKRGGTNMTPGSSVSTQSFTCAPARPTEEHALSWNLCQSFPPGEGAPPRSVIKLNWCPLQGDVKACDRLSICKSVLVSGGLSVAWHVLCWLWRSVHDVRRVCRHIRMNIKERSKHSCKKRKNTSQSSFTLHLCSLFWTLSLVFSRSDCTSLSF